MSNEKTRRFIAMVKERYALIGDIVMSRPPEKIDAASLETFALERVAGQEALMHAVIGNVFAMTKSAMLPADIGAELYKRCEKLAEDLHNGFLAQATLKTSIEAQKSKAVH